MPDGISSSQKLSSTVKPPTPLSSKAQASKAYPLPLKTKLPLPRFRHEDEK